MSLEQLKVFILQSDVDEIDHYISVNKQEVKLLFANSAITTENTSYSKAVTRFLHHLDHNSKRIESFQFLFTNLAFYFKKANNPSFVTTCINNLTDSILKYRLQAWHQYKTYSQNASHLLRFDAYLAKLSKAISDETEEYLEDVLNDLYDYYSEKEGLANFQIQFDDEELLDKYPLLREFKRVKTSLEYKIESHETVNKIYYPSPFADKLFKEKFIDYIKDHADTEWHQILLGYASWEVRERIIKHGQAKFDDSYKKLNSDDIVKLYCYLNMRMHYFSTLYLFERCTWLKKVITKAGCAKFIDIGCGPATCGVALTSHLLSLDDTFIPFDYIGIDYYNSMLRAAEDLMDNDVYTSCSQVQYANSIQAINPDILLNANSIILNACYLFASPSLEIDELAKDVNALLKANENVPRFLLFQNAVGSSKNIKYKDFKKKLLKHEVLLTDTMTIMYNNQQSSYKPKDITVYFEVLKFKDDN